MIGACESRGMGFNACGSVVLATKINACGLTETNICGAMLVVKG